MRRLLAEFRDYLLVERALTPGSVGLYEPVARLFLEERSAPIGEDLARLSGREIHAFVLREARQRGQRSAETMVAALRSLLRFLHVQGWIATPLATAVPSVRRRREGLPRGLAAGQVRLLLESCDRERPAGRRDFAILMLLARLGLRRGEVAALELDDVDWRAGEIVIRGKGSPGLTGCRSPAMSVRRWWITFATVARAASAGGWCCRRARRMTSSRPARSPLL